MSKPLWYGTGAYIPTEVATCPECGGELVARSMDWENDSGRPIATGLEVDCAKDYSPLHATAEGHRYQQNKWQPVRDKIAAWCGARTELDTRPPRL